MPNYGQFTSSTFKSRFDGKQRDKARRNFERSDGHWKGEITRDGNIIPDYQAHIFNLSIDAKEVKEYVSHPDQALESGDIVDYTDGYKYLVIRQDRHGDVSNFGKLTRMNSTVKFRKPDGKVIEMSYALEGYGIGAQDENNKIPSSRVRKIL